MISKTKVNGLLEVIAGVTDISLPGVVYLGLCVTEPAASDGKVNDEPDRTVNVDGQVINTGYERMLVGGSGTNVSKYFGNASGGIIKNNKEIQMKTARREWGHVYYWFLSESSAGNATIWGKINGDAGINIAAETVPVFYENELKASIDVPLT